jgi:hypothetical protein
MKQKTVWSGWQEMAWRWGPGKGEKGMSHGAERALPGLAEIAGLLEVSI